MFDASVRGLRTLGRVSRQAQIVVTGAREHNLKDVTVAMPRDALVVITGLSGSGKSSLAFDTIYAEGQRRYVESLSAYARQFLGQMDKPDVDSIEGLSPAISIDQKTTSRNPRSTVGTVTEIYDYLRLLWARIGKPHCFNCGRPIAAQSAEQIIDQIMGLEDGHAVHGHGADRARAQGRVRQAVRGAARRGLHAREGRRRDAAARGGDRPRQEVQARHRGRGRPAGDEAGRAQAAGRLGRDRGRARRRDPRDRDAAARRRRAQIQTFSERFACLHCGISMPELEPRIFSFNSPHGACPRCTGLGSQMEIDPDLVVPDPSLSIDDGAILPWASGASTYYDQITQAIAERYEIDLQARWEDLPEEQQDLFLYGTNGDRIYVTYRNRMGRKRSYMTNFEGIVPNLERRYKETDSDWSREKIEEYMTMRPCPECKGARLRPESRAVQVAGLAIHEFTAMSAQAVARVGRRARAVGSRPRDRAADPARDRGAAAVPRQRRRRLPEHGAGGGDAVGRRGAADPARDADRLVAGGRALHPRRAVDRPAPARQRAADRDAGAAARPRQHRARGRARRGHDARGRPRDRHGARRRRARRPRRRTGDGGRGRGGAGVADRASSSRARAQIEVPAQAPDAVAATSRSPARRSTTSRTST